MDETSASRCLEARSIQVESRCMHTSTKGKGWEQRRHGGHCAIFLLVAASLVFSLDVWSTELGDAQITLLNHLYYRQWNLTRLMYRVKSASPPSETSWVLGLGSCIQPDDLLWVTSPAGWVEAPFRGLRMTREMKNETVTIWLWGEWESAAVPVAFVRGRSGEEIDTGQIDGPACEAASISIDVIEGASILFPPFDGAGLYEAEAETGLRVSSTSAGWALSYHTNAYVPENASSVTATESLVVTVQPYQTRAGEIDLWIGYTLRVDEEDLAALPEGTYLFEIRYTVSTD